MALLHGKPKGGAWFFRDPAIPKPLLTKIGTLQDTGVVGQNPEGFVEHLRFSGVLLAFW